MLWHQALTSAETQAADREDGPKYAGKKPADLEMSNPESVPWPKHWRLYVAIGFVAVLVLMGVSFAVSPQYPHVELAASPSHITALCSALCKGSIFRLFVHA